MARVKVILNKNEDIEEVKEKLGKAFVSQAERSHEGEKFLDPVVEDIEKKWFKESDALLNKILLDLDIHLKEEKF